eukprot:1252728-Rhodomonas_salina.1
MQAKQLTSLVALMCLEDAQAPPQQQCLSVAAYLILSTGWTIHSTCLSSMPANLNRSRDMSVIE